MKFNSRAVVFILLSALLLFPFAQAQPARPVAQAAQQRLDFAESLRQGRQLLRRGKADQALPLLESALKLATEANHPREIAQAHDALGDLYTRPRQYATALTHYQQAREGFQAAAAAEAPTKQAVGLGGGRDNSGLQFTQLVRALPP